MFRSVFRIKFPVFYIFLSINSSSHTKKKSWNPHRNWFIKAATSAALCVCIITRFSSLFALFSLVNNYYCTKSLRLCVCSNVDCFTGISESFVLCLQCAALFFSSLSVRSLSLSARPITTILSSLNTQHVKQSSNFHFKLCMEKTSQDTEQECHVLVENFDNFSRFLKFLKNVEIVSIVFKLPKT